MDNKNKNYPPETNENGKFDRNSVSYMFAFEFFDKLLDQLDKYVSL